jgi:hypothetical protein
VVDDSFLTPNRVWILPAVRACESVERSSGYRLALAAALLWAIVAALHHRPPPGERLFLAFTILTVLWVAGFGIGLEYGENNRFRFPLLGLMTALFVYAVRDGMRALRRPFTKA